MVYKCLTTLGLTYNINSNHTTVCVCVCEKLGKSKPPFGAAASAEIGIFAVGLFFSFCLVFVRDGG